MTKNIPLSVYFSVLVYILKVQSQLELDEGERCYNEIDGLNGTCVRIHRCLSVVHDIKTKKRPQLCSFRGVEPIICCTDCEIVEDNSIVFVSKEGRHYFKTGQKATDKCLGYITSLEYNCTMKEGLFRQLDFDRETCFSYSALRPVGRVIRSDNLRIKRQTVGGQAAERGEYPHMALLGFGDSLDAAQWLCGGSVISDRFILTAAHCTFSRSFGSVRFVALGILKRTDPSETWQRYETKRIITHPQYKPPSRYHDIALLELTARINFNSAVLPACLQVGESLETEAIATGWGDLGHNRPLADTLQEVLLKKFSDDECSAAYPPNRNLIIGLDQNTQACYGDKEKIVDTCKGDSGGPVQVKSSHGVCVFKIVGVTSFGPDCGFLGNTGIYTKVAFYIPWIESIVWP